jgi:RNA polymerase sigma-70 factor (ECF subfamily)
MKKFETLPECPPVTDESDEVLSARARQGCGASFAALVERHYDRIYRLAWRFSASRDAAEDIAQTVCVKLASAIRDYRGEAAFTTWLYRIAFTTAADHRRAMQHTEPLEPAEIVRLIDGQAGADGSGREVADLWVAVDALPGQQRDAVLLVYGEDMSHAEAAAVMGCSEKTVSWHVHEARKRLRVSLSEVG